MRKIGISFGFPYLNSSFYEKMVASGITAAELSTSPAIYPALPLKHITAEMRNCGVTPWSFHFPFTPFEYVNPASPDSVVRAETVRYLSELLKRANDAGYTRFVIHASGEPISESDRQEALKNACDTVNILGDVALSCGSVIAVEDLPRTCLGNCHKDILTLIGNHPALGVCFDTNHLTQEPGEEFLKAVGNRLVTVHVSDFDFENERHWLPGEGKINWQSLMNALDAVNYDGVFMYEVPFGATKTIAREKDLMPEDFYRNACELHNRSLLTRHGVPYPNLGLWGPKDRE